MTMRLRRLAAMLGPEPPRIHLLACLALCACTPRSRDGGAPPREEVAPAPAATEPGSPRTSGPESPPPDEGADGPAPQAEVIEPIAPLPRAAVVPKVPRPYVVYRWTNKKRRRVVPFLVRDGASLQRLSFELEYGEGGAAQKGGLEPVLSWDAAWLAFEDRKGIVAHRTDGSAVQRVFEQEKGREVGLYLTAFSPDGKTLLFYQEAPYDMEEGELPTPAGFVPGFVRFDLETLTLAPVRHLEGFDGWTHDGRGVFHVRSEGNLHRLEAVDLFEAKEARVLQSFELTYGPSQLDFAGDAMAFSLGSRIVWSRLDGSELVKVTPRGGFADYQWPKLSPDGTHVAYQWQTELRVVRLADVEGVVYDLWTCSARCPFAWVDDHELLLLDDEVLHRVRWDRGPVVAAEGVAGVAMAGAPA